MDTLQSSSRRRFLKGSALLGGGLLIGFTLPPALRRAEAATAAAPFAPNAWIRVGTDGAVTIIVDKSEMGQGVLTSLPMIAAEELKVDWREVSYQQAPADKAYFNPMFGAQGTGGSTSVRGERGQVLQSSIVWLGDCASGWPADCVTPRERGKDRGYRCRNVRSWMIEIKDWEPLMLLVSTLCCRLLGTVACTALR
ncbi:MAG TPA: molybdopterin cofactor-binding domain-containing protein [Gammaproteobacteria bacterium]|nr:molybdopterin cofactor-binding domain-containing protein [Gammaproteobacteria bacterium]